MSILVPVSTSDKVVSFSDHARNKVELGELNYEQFCNIEMLELGYSPSNPKDVLEYKHFIESLSEEDFKISNFTENLPAYISKTVFGPVKNEEDRRSIICSECSAQHLVIHEERLLGVSLTGIFDNPLTYNPKPEMLEKWREMARGVNMEWESIVCLHCGYIIYNPEKEV